MSENLNPYAAPKAEIEQFEHGAEVEKIRQEHLNTEASIKAVGTLYILGCVITLFGGFAVVLRWTQNANEISDPSFLSILAMLCFGGLQGFAGYALRHFRRWSRLAGTVISVVGLLAFPIGTIISGYILYLLWSKKGRTVFTAEYQGVIAATPHIRYKTSMVVWVALGVIILLVVAGAIIAIIGRS